MHIKLLKVITISASVFLFLWWAYVYYLEAFQEPARIIKDFFHASIIEKIFIVLLNITLLPALIGTMLHAYRLRSFKWLVLNSFFLPAIYYVFYVAENLEIEESKKSEESCLDITKRVNNKSKLTAKSAAASQER